jgi:chromosome segregation protein
MKPFLTRLEIQGFKSFANKTSFEFPARVTGVVGPNGSGKSNIVDALRWVLGERTAKQLRGESLSNLIFSGTPKKPAASLARVALHINNQDRVFPFDTAEVIMERKVDRSGNSRLFINKAETRLREIQPLLARAKLGTRGLTIIGQGQSDLFVKSTPKERRIMIEEILGLKEFRLKKEDAERRLKASQTNMEKVTAMINELAPHLKFLRKQKSRWEKRSEIEQELTELEKSYFGFHKTDITKKLEEITTPTNELLKEKGDKEREIQKLEHDLREFEKGEGQRTERAALKKEREKLSNEKSGIEHELIRLETKLELQKEAPRNSVPAAELQKSVKELHHDLQQVVTLKDVGAIKQKLSHWIGVFNKFFGTKPKEEQSHVEREIKERIHKLRIKQGELMDQLTTIQRKENAHEEAQASFNKKFRALVTTIEETRNKVRNLERKMESTHLTHEKLKMKYEELETQWEALGKTKDELRHLKSAEAPPHDAEKKIFRLRGELAAIGETDKEAIKEAKETEERHEFLTKEKEDIERASEDLQTLVGNLEKKIHEDFKSAFRKISNAFNDHIALMFGGGKARLKLIQPTIRLDTDEAEIKEEVNEDTAGIDIDVSIPRKKIKSLEMLSGGEKSLVSMAALFALISISAPPFLVLDEIDAALDDENARRFAELVKKFSKSTQFLIVTHNRITSEHADILYGITMEGDGVSKVLSLKLDIK